MNRQQYVQMRAVEDTPPGRSGPPLPPTLAFCADYCRNAARSAWAHRLVVVAVRGKTVSYQRSAAHTPNCSNRQPRDPAAIHAGVGHSVTSVDLVKIIPNPYCPRQESEAGTTRLRFVMVGAVTGGYGSSQRAPPRVFGEGVACNESIG